MNKPKIILAAICLMAATGGAFAFKAQRANLFYWANNTYNPTIADPCPVGPLDCTTRTIAGGPIVTLYTLVDEDYIKLLRANNP